MGRGDGLGVGVRPRRTGPEADTSVPARADVSGGPRARRVEDGVEEASRINMSCDGGGSGGKDIASREADNLWVCNAPGGLDSAVGKVPTPGTKEEREKDDRAREQAGPFPPTRQGRNNAVRGRARPTAG
jgi:hypothetical protein